MGGDEYWPSGGGTPSNKMFGSSHPCYTGVWRTFCSRFEYGYHTEWAKRITKHWLTYFLWFCGLFVYWLLLILGNISLLITCVQHYTKFPILNITIVVLHSTFGTSPFNVAHRLLCISTVRSYQFKAIPFFEIRLAGGFHHRTFLASIFLRCVEDGLQVQGGFSLYWE